MTKKWFIKQRIDDRTFIEVCNNAQSMSEAASELGLHFNSFKKRAIELDCYKPNQAGIGIRKNMPKIPLSEIIEYNLHPNYQTYKLKQRDGYYWTCIEQNSSYAKVCHFMSMDKFPLIRDFGIILSLPSRLI